MKINFFRKNYRLYLVFFFIFMITLFIRLSFVGLIPFWREDGYQYLAKAEEILKGDFSSRFQDMGLPLFYSFFLLFLGSGDLFKDIPIAQILLAVVESLILLPIFLISIRFFKWKSALLASLFFTFWPGLIRWTALGYTEPLFSFLLLFSFYFLIKSDKSRYYLLFASAFAGLAFWVRVNGIFFFPSILVFSWIYRKKIPRWRWSWLICIILVFILIISPYFILRLSSQEYSIQSRMAKYLFSDYHQQLFDPEFNPTLSSYLSVHSVNDLIFRGWKGIINFLQSMYKANPFLMTLTFLGLLIFTRKKFLCFHFVFLFWLLGFFWIYAVVRSGRFILPLMSFSIILSAGLIGHILEERKRAWFLMILVLVFFVYFYSMNFFHIRSNLKYQGVVLKDARKWGVWIAQNIPKGETLAIREGIDIAAMTAPKIEVKTIPYRKDLEEIWKHLRKNKINYLAMGSGSGEPADWNRIPVLREIRRKSLAPFLVRIYSDEKLKWHMEIFKINWDKKDVLYKRGEGDVIEAESLATLGISKFDTKASNDFAVLVKESSYKQNSILLGPVESVPPGKYRVSFRLKANDFKKENFHIGLDILLKKRKEILGRKTIRGDAFKSEDVYYDFECAFNLKSEGILHFKITSQGTGELWVDRISFSQAD